MYIIWLALLVRRDVNIDCHNIWYYNIWLSYYGKLLYVQIKPDFNFDLKVDQYKFNEITFNDYSSTKFEPRYRTCLERKKFLEHSWNDKNRSRNRRSWNDREPTKVNGIRVLEFEDEKAKIVHAKLRDSPLNRPLNRNLV